MFLKHCFTSYCSVFQYPILKAACIDKDESWTAEILNMHSQETNIFIKVNIMPVNIFFFGFIGLISYILTSPRNFKIGTVVGKYLFYLRVLRGRMRKQSGWTSKSSKMDIYFESI